MIKTLLHFRNFDSTLDLNSQLSEFFSRGIISGGQVLPVPSVLQVQVTPFKLIGVDGMVVLETATTAILNVVAGETNVIVFNSSYVTNDNPIAQFEVLELSVYLARVDIAHLTIFAYVTLAGGDTQVSPTEISYIKRDEIDPVQRLVLRGTLTNASLLPVVINTNRPGDSYIVTSGLGDNPALYVWNGVSWLDITDTLLVASLLSAHRNNLFSNEIHLTDNQAAAALGSYGAPSSVNPYVTSTDPRMASQTEADALVGVPNGVPNTPPSSTNPYVTGVFPIAQPVAKAFSASPGSAIILAPGDGPIYVGTAGAGTALQYFKIYHATLQREFLNSGSQAIQITGVFKDFAETQPLIPSAEAGVIADNGFYTGALYLTFSAALDFPSRLLYGQKKSLQSIDKGFLLHPQPTSAETTQETLLRMESISGRLMDDPVPTDEQNIILREDVNLLRDYVNATTASDLVANNRIFPRMRNTPEFAPLFPLNTGEQVLVASGPFTVGYQASDITTFDPALATPDVGACAVIQYTSPVSLATTFPGYVFLDGAGIRYRILAVKSTGNGSLLVYTRGRQINTTVGASSGQVLKGNNPRQIEILNDSQTSLYREVISIENLEPIIGAFEDLPPGGNSVGAGSAYSLIGTPLLPNQGNAVGVPSGRPLFNIVPKQQGNNVDPRVLLVGDWKSDQKNFPGQVIGEVSQGGLGIEYTGRLTDLMLYTAYSVNMPTGIQVFIDGKYSSTASQFLSGPNLGGYAPSGMLQTLRGPLEAVLQPILFPLGLSGTQIHTVRIEFTQAGSVPLPLFGLEVFYGAGLQQEAVNAFTNAELVQAAASFNPIPLLANTLRGTRTTQFIDRTSKTRQSVTSTALTLYSTGTNIVAGSSSFNDGVLAASAQVGDVFLISDKTTTPISSPFRYDTADEIYTRCLSVNPSTGAITVDQAVPFAIPAAPSGTKGSGGRVEFVFRVPSRVSDGQPILAAPPSKEEFEYARFLAADWNTNSTNDVSKLSEDASDSKVTVLNDASTALLVSQCQRVSSGIAGYTQGIQLNTTTSFVTLTAWGTRQDLIFIGNNGPATITIEIDGRYSYNVTLTGTGLERHTAFFQGNAQSHTVRIKNPSVGQRVVIGAICLHDLAPASFNGTVLSDYCVGRNIQASSGLQDFAYTATANPCIVSNTSIRLVDMTKGMARYYVGNSSLGSTPWRILPDFTNNPRFGYYVETDEANAQVDLFAEGSHFELYYEADANKGQAQVYINDILAIPANYGTLFTYGALNTSDGRLNSSTAMFDMYSAAPAKMRLVLSGLPFGRYKITIRNNGLKNVASGGFFMRFYEFAENPGIGSVMVRNTDDKSPSHLHFGSFRDLRQFVTLLPSQVGLVDGSGGGGSSTPGITTLQQAKTGLMDLASEPYWFGIINDWSDDADVPASPFSPAYSAAGYTNPSTYKSAPAGLTLGYDATQLYSVSGAVVTLTAPVSWAVTPTDLVGAVFQPLGATNPGIIARIISAASLLQFTLDQTLTTVVPVNAESVAVKQCLHTKDLVQFKPGTSGDNQSIADRLPVVIPPSLIGAISSDIGSVKFEAEASTVTGAAGNDPIWNGTPLVSYQLNRKGLRTDGATPDLADDSFWSIPYTTKGYEEENTSIVYPPGSVSNQRLFLRVFPAQTSGSGSINLLRWSAMFFDVLATTPNAGSSRYARGYTDNSIPATGMTVSVFGGKTRLTFSEPFEFNAFPNTPKGIFRFLMDGKEFVRAGAPGYNYAPNEGTFTEVSAFIVDLDSDYSSIQASMDVIFRDNFPGQIRVSTLAPFAWEVSGYVGVPGKPSDGVRTAFEGRNFTQLKLRNFNSGTSGATVIEIFQNGLVVANASLPATGVKGSVYVPVAIQANVGDEFEMQITAVAMNAQDVSVELA